jgi:hypothetical protein
MGSQGFMEKPVLINEGASFDRDEIIRSKLMKKNVVGIKMPNRKMQINHNGKLISNK